MHVRRLLWLLVALSGCGGRKPAAMLTCAPPECAADTSLALVAEVEPPSDSPFVRQEFPALDLDPQSGQFVLTLDPQVTLEGVVRIGSGTTAELVPATVVATRPSRIPGRPDVYYQSTVNPATGEYKLVVSPNLGGTNETYTLRVTASDPTLVPPKQLQVKALEDQTLDLVFEDPLTLPEVHGAVLDSLSNPVPGMQVKAIDPGTSRVVSTTATTDARGAFSLRLVANPPEQIVVEAAPTADAAGALPSLALDVSTKLGAANALTANLRVPPLPAPSHLYYKVGGTSPSGADTPVMGAACVFTADVTDPNATDGTVATYQAVGTTDALGNVTVDLIPADSGNRAYTVTVTPDAASTFGASSQQVSVGPQGGFGGSITLQLRPQLSGSVYGPDDTAVRGLMVVPSQATVAATIGPSPYATSTAPPQTVADADGRFALRLDAGVWDIGLIPPPESMLPRLWMTGTDVEQDTDFGAIVLPRGVLVRGVLHDPSGNPLGLANVRLYTVAAGNAACSDASCLAPPRLRAEGSSGTDGQVGLILPSEPR